MDIVSLLIQLVSGAEGGNILGGLIKQVNVGPLGNTIVGIIGAVITSLATGKLGAGTDLSSITSILASVGVNAAGGGVLTVVVGLIKQALAKKA